MTRIGTLPCSRNFRLFAPTTRGILSHGPPTPMLSPVNGFSATNSTPMARSLAIRPDGCSAASLNNRALILRKPLARLSNPPPSALFFLLLYPKIGLSTSWTSKTPFFMALSLKLFFANNHPVSLTPTNLTMCVGSTNLSMV